MSNFAEKMSRYGKFLSAFLSNPLQTGSIIPSSRFLANSILINLDFTNLKKVVEFGPGSGAITKYLSDVLQQSECKLHLVEMNPDFFEALKENFPEAHVHLGAASSILSYEGIEAGSVDVVISSLPFTVIPWDETQQTILQTYKVIKPGGTFRTYIYVNTILVKKNQRLLELLREVFGEVKIWFEWRNMPPAFVIDCKKTSK
jgi:phospholipid N-methyltransferase